MEDAPQTVTQEDPVLQQPIIRITPLRVNIHEDFDDGPVAFIRKGARVSLVAPDGEIPFSKNVWERGMHLPFRPFFEKRVLLAKDKAARIAGTLAVENG